MTMSHYLEQSLRNAQAADVTELFLWVLLGIFVTSIFCSFICKASRFTAYTPNLLTSVGILGTFAGIVIGLMAFDPSDIDHSISLLLDGLKTAFITSLAGMGSSIVFKVLSTTPLLNRRRAGNGKDVGPMLVDAMQEQSQHMKALRSAIAGEEESSLSGQIKLLRSDTNDHARTTQQQLELGVKLLNSLRKSSEQQHAHFQSFAQNLWQQMEAFGEMLSKSATEQVISALKEVIVDFNKNLTEQFGENFKALDASVQRLVEWQENYKTQLGQMSEQYQQGVSAITQTEASVAQISEKSQAIPEVMGQLQEVLAVNQHQINELDRHLDAFVEVRDKAVAAVPEIHGQIEMMTNSVAESTRTLADGVAASGEKMLSTVAEGASNFAEAVDKHLDGLKDRIDSSTEKLTEGILESTHKVSSSIAGGLEEFDNNVQRLSGNLTSTSDMLAEQTETIRQHLQDTMNELNSNARNMVESLVEGSQALVKDTQAMNQTLQQTGQQIEQDVSEIQKKVADSITQMQKRLESTLEEVFQAQTREMNRVLGGVEAAVKTAVERTGEGVNAQIEMIDVAMQQEIERVMNEMGQALARISNQFTSDYSSLVAAMDKVVRQGRNT